MGESKREGPYEQPAVQAREEQLQLVMQKSRNCQPCPIPGCTELNREKYNEIGEAMCEKATLPLQIRRTSQRLFTPGL